MSKASAVSIHPQQEAIDRALALGEESLQTLATRFNVSPYALSRRRKRLAITPAVEADDLQAQALKWRERADQLWHQGTTDADSRAMAQAVSAGLRSVELQARQKEREVEAVSVAEEADDGKLDIGTLSKVLDWYDRCFDDNQKRTVLKAAELERQLGVSDSYELFNSMSTSPELRQAVLEFAHNFQLEKKNNEPVQMESAANEPGLSSRQRPELQYAGNVVPGGGK
jgi:hypothetical protein